MNQKKYVSDSSFVNCFDLLNQNVDWTLRFLFVICNISLHRVFIYLSSKLALKEESIVNAPLVSLQRENTNNTKSEVRFKQLIRDL
jgi:hypothetical protein